METLWLHYGNTKEILWIHYGNTMGTLWKYYGNTKKRRFKMEFIKEVVVNVVMVLFFVPTFFMWFKDGWNSK